MPKLRQMLGLRGSKIEVNVIDEEPKKALELKAAMSKYLESIDAEDIQEVYQARFAELDRFETMARSVQAKAIEQAKGDQSLVAEADERLANDLACFEKNRVQCRGNMRGKTFKLVCQHWDPSDPCPR